MFLRTSEKLGVLQVSPEPSLTTTTELVASLENAVFQAGRFEGGLRQALGELMFGQSGKSDDRLVALLETAVHASQSLVENVQALFLLKAAGIDIDRSEIEQKLARLPETVHGMQTAEEVRAAHRLMSLDWTKLLDALEQRI